LRPGQQQWQIGRGPLAVSAGAGKSTGMAVARATLVINFMRVAS